MPAPSPTGKPMLSSIEISGFRGFSQAQGLRLAVPQPGKPGSGLTFIVGPNNGGKSTVLESIDLVLRGKTVQIARPSRNDSTNYQAKIRGTWSNGQTCGLESDPANPIQMALNGKNPQQPMAYVAGSRNLPAQIGGPAPKRSEHFNNQPHAFQRNISEFLAARIGNWQRAEVSGRFFKMLNSVLDFELRIFNEGSALHVKVGGHEHDPRGLGAGIISLLHFIDAMYDAEDGSAIVIDEPENSLHPAFQKNLLRLFLEEAKRLQIIYATHSPFLVDWEAILNGAALARVHRPDGAYSTVSQLLPQTADALAGFLTNLRNPHILGIDAKEVFFLTNGIVLVEGQDDVIFYKRMAEQAGIPIEGTFYGWGAGGAENMPRLVRVLHDLGFGRVVGVLDDNKPETLASLKSEFPQYQFCAIPASDVRDKDKVKGLCSSSGSVHPERMEEVKAFLKDLNRRLRSRSA